MEAGLQSARNASVSLARFAVVPTALQLGARDFSPRIIPLWGGQTFLSVTSSPHRFAGGCPSGVLRLASACLSAGRRPRLPASHFGSDFYTTFSATEFPHLIHLPRPKVLLTISLFVLTALTTGCEFFRGPQPPLARLQNAKDALERAAASGSIKYSEGAYRHAERLIQTGWMEMARQNGRISIFRNYFKADSLLRRAESVAEHGMRETQDSLNTLDKRQWKEIRDYENELNTWRDALDGSLILFQAERIWTDADIHLSSAKQLAKIKEYEESHRSVALGRQRLARLGEFIAKREGDEAASMKIWRQWVDAVVEQSKRDQIYAIAVDKVAHKTYLLKNGRVVRTYQSELGYNSASNKLFAGDGATPEGTYKVTKVKIGDTKYYKALLLNYPSEADYRRFADNKRNGIISKHSGIGRLIEVHGDGGSGSDWTDGCVALTNADMDHLVKHVGVGTPVVIVRRYDGGSL